MSDTNVVEKYLGKTSTEILVTNIKNYVKNSARNQIVFKDDISGFEYLLEMHGGELVSCCKAAGVEITQMPEKMEYIVGETVDFTGMSVRALCQDGTVRQVNNCYCDVSVFDTAGEIPVTLTYTEAGVDHTAIFAVMVTDPYQEDLVESEIEYDTVEDNVEHNVVEDDTEYDMAENDDVENEEMGS